MEIGQLTERLRVEKRREADQPDGTVDVVWDPIATVWAAVVPKQGMELLEAEQMTNRTTHRVTIHWQSGIRAGHYRFVRVRDDAILTIEAVLDLVSGHRWLQCRCREET